MRTPPARRVLDADDPARWDAFHADRVDDVAFYVEEARRSGGPVLEAACGTGRVALAIAGAGIDVAGFDADPARVARAEAKRRTARPPGRAAFWVADLRAPGARGAAYERVLIPFRGLQSLLTTADHVAALEAAARVLRPDGRLVFDVHDPDPALLADAAEGPTPLEPTGREVVAEDGVRVVERFTRRYDPRAQVIEQTFVYERTDSAGRVLAHAYEPLSVRVLFRFEIEHLLARTGYEIEALHGGWRREPYDATGEDMVWIARRRQP